MSPPTMTTIAELKEDKKQMEEYIAELEEDKKQMKEHYEELIAKMKRQDEDDESDEEVKCICEDCFLEGRVMVSKKRAEYLKKNEIMEYSCVVCDAYSASALSDEEEDE